MGVTTPMPNASSPVLPGIGGRAAAAANPYGVAQDPLAQFRAMVDTPNAQGGAAGGTIKWEQYGDARFEDQALRDIRNESNTENDINQVYVVKYAQACAEFAMFLMARRGLYYDEYRNILENFRLNLKTHAPCAIRNEFVNTVNRHPELIQGIARAAAPMYGQRLVNIAKSKPTGEVDRSEYLASIHFAIRNVLTMEMISWLCKTPQGRQQAYNLTPEIKHMVGQLETYKDIFGVACATFGVTNPYSGLVYDVQLPTRTDISLISESQTAFMYNSYSNEQGVDSHSQNVSGDIYKMIQRNANLAKRSAQQGTAYVEQDEDQPRWDKYRSDIQNITPTNKKSYDYRRFFHYIGKENHYMVPESDWKTIQHVFRRHPDQPPQEESVLHGCFRIVIIDLEHDSGWFSTVVRGEGLDMPTVLTNPSKLLPLLEGEQDSTNVVVKQMAVEAALGKKNKSLEIPVETCNTLEGIPVVTVKELIATNNSKKLMAAVITTNDHLTKNFKTVNATSFNTVIWESYTCDDAAERATIIEDLPFLFKDGKEEGRPLSFFMKMQKLNNYFREGMIGDELANFIDSRLTILTNEWLVSCLGYSNNPNSPRHLSVTSIVRDYDDLEAILEEEDEEGHRWFNAPPGPENFLTENMKIFTAEDKYDSIGGDQGMIQKAQKLQELTMERALHITVINKRHGLVAEQDGEPLLIKRSKFPEYFDLVEKGFEPTMGSDKNIRVTDKLLQFSSDEHLWAFNYTSMDRNVATLRRVSRRQSLLFLPLI